VPDGTANHSLRLSAFRLRIYFRHCERSEAIQCSVEELDYFVASLLAMTGRRSGLERRTKAGATTCFSFAPKLRASRDRFAIARAPRRAAKTDFYSPPASRGEGNESASRERPSISSLPDLIRQSMRPVRSLDRAAYKCGASAWTAGSSPVVTRGGALAGQEECDPP
jgi:hypothetical protein